MIWVHGCMPIDFCSIMQVLDFLKCDASISHGFYWNPYSLSMLSNRRRKCVARCGCCQIGIWPSLRQVRKRERGLIECVWSTWHPNQQNEAKKEVKWGVVLSTQPHPVLIIIMYVCMGREKNVFNFFWVLDIFLNYMTPASTGSSTLSRLILFAFLTR